MDVKVNPSRLEGIVTAPSSKSAAHRALICACFAGGTSRLSNMGENDDIKASISAAKALGATCSYEGGVLIVEGISSLPTTMAPVECNESGSTLRFFAPLAGALGISASFHGKGRLPQRPMEPILSLLRTHGVDVGTKEGAIFTSSGQLQSGVFELPGNISSQYITGLLFALPLIDGNSIIRLTTPLESAGYVDMTLQMLLKFGIIIESVSDGYKINGNQTYQPQTLTIEGDYSGAAFWLAAAAIGHPVTVAGLDMDSLQADKGILKVLEDFGSIIHQSEKGLLIEASALTATEIDASGIPDSVPALAVVAAHATGTTRIYNAERLKIKESDRLESTCVGLKNLGATIEVTDDGLLITGGAPLHGGTIDSYADHRIAMSMSIGALSADSPTTITGAQCVEKSYPDFYKDLEMLGGNVNVL